MLKEIAKLIREKMADDVKSGVVSISTSLVWAGVKESVDARLLHRFTIGAGVKSSARDLEFIQGIDAYIVKNLETSSIGEQNHEVNKLKRMCRDDDLTERNTYEIATNSFFKFEGIWFFKSLAISRNPKTGNINGVEYSIRSLTNQSDKLKRLVKKAVLKRGLINTAESRKVVYSQGRWISYLKDNGYVHSKTSKELLERLETFYTKEHKEKCEVLGIPYKNVILLHGEPGSGKSKFVAHAAHAMNKHLNVWNIKDLTTELLTEISRFENEVVLFEDIDASAILDKRYQKTGRQDQTSPLTTIKDARIERQIHFDDFINFLNGPIPLKGVTVFMTTNFLDKLDPALTRKGRVEELVELPRIERDTIVNDLKISFPYLQRNPEKLDFLTADLWGKELNDVKLTGLHGSENCKELLELLHRINDEYSKEPSFYQKMIVSIKNKFK